MSVSSDVTLPAQPAAGNTVWQPLGGDGTFSPHGCYISRNEIQGDASGGNATLRTTLDSRYTNLVAFVNARIQVDAAAGDFRLVVQPTLTEEGVEVVGTMPQISTGFAANASFLWYPPPLYHPGTGVVLCGYPNVGVGELYQLVIQVYTFNIDIRRLTPLPFLQGNVPGVSAPAAV